MPTPKSWYEAAQRALNDEKARLEPEYRVKRRDSARNVLEVQLFAVSLVSDPLPGYEARIVRHDPDEEAAIDHSAFFGITDPGD